MKQETRIQKKSPPVYYSDSYGLEYPRMQAANDQRPRAND